MDGKDLLKALMKEAGLNPNALADRLKKRSLQSQVTRFLDGSTRNPRWDTLRPVAEFFNVGVEAFFDSDIADQVAQERGLLQPKEAQSVDKGEGFLGSEARESAPPPTPLRPAAERNQVPIRELLLQLAGALEPYDLSARKAVASLLGDLATSPETASTTAQRIERLLADPGNDLPQKSTASPPGRRR
jgi:transcriptional regulator with XRE-family HTH domain